MGKLAEKSVDIDGLGNVLGGEGGCVEGLCGDWEFWVSGEAELSNEVCHSHALYEA